jgi:hypothetical protein
MSNSVASLSPRRMPRKRWPLVLRLAPVLVGAMLAMTVAVAVTADTARLTAPAQAPSGSTITVIGSGLVPGQTGQLTFNGGVVTTFAASSTGWFSVPFTIPDIAVNGRFGRISAKDATSNLLATTLLLIDPSAATPASLTVPSQAPPGSTIAVSGSGFSPGQSGYLTINGLAITTFVASLDGSFSVPFDLPSATRIGTGRISARDNANLLIATTTLLVATGSGATPTPTPVITDQPTDTPSPAPGTTDQPTSAPPPATSTPAAPSPIPTLGATDQPTAPPTPPTTPAPTSQPTAPPTLSPTASPTGSPSVNLPNFSHVYVIVLENTEFSGIVGSSSAPYINSLIAQYGLSTNSYAVAHPSEPNYIAMTSGGTQGITDDGVYNLAVNNVFDQVDASGRTWAAYQQGYPGGCYTGSSALPLIDGAGKAGGYVRKHNPAISYTSISSNPARCANITSLASFNPAAANFEFITPNLVNDMHDGTVADGDNFLKAFLPQITGSAAFANSVVFITFDEGTSNINGGGQIATIAITPNMTPGYKATGAYTHYSLLRTIEQAWGLPYLGNAASAAPMDFPY